MFRNEIKNPKTTLGGLALIAHAIFLVLGALSGEGGLSDVPVQEVFLALTEALAGFGLLKARDADRRSEDQ